MGTYIDTYRLRLDLGPLSFENVLEENLALSGIYLRTYTQSSILESSFLAGDESEPSNYEAYVQDLNFDFLLDTANHEVLENTALLSYIQQVPLDTPGILDELLETDTPAEYQLASYQLSRNVLGLFFGMPNWQVSEDELPDNFDLSVIQLLSDGVLLRNYANLSGFFIDELITHFIDHLHFIPVWKNYQTDQRLLVEELSLLFSILSGRLFSNSVIGDVTFNVALDYFQSALFLERLRIYPSFFLNRQYLEDLRNFLTFNDDYLSQWFYILSFSLDLATAIDSQVAWLFKTSLSITPFILGSIGSTFLFEERPQFRGFIYPPSALSLVLDDTFSFIDILSLRAGFFHEDLFRSYNISIALPLRYKGASFHAYAFTSAASFRGKVYYAFEDGIYTEGDNPVAGEVMFTGSVAPGLTRLDALYIEGLLRNAQVIQVTDDYLKEYVVYGNKVRGAKGLRGRRHVFIISGVEDLYAALFQLYKLVRRLT